MNRVCRAVPFRQSGPTVQQVACKSCRHDSRMAAPSTFSQACQSEYRAGREPSGPNHCEGKPTRPAFATRYVFEPSRNVALALAPCPHPPLVVSIKAALPFSPASCDLSVSNVESPPSFGMGITDPRGPLASSCKAVLTSEFNRPALRATSNGATPFQGLSASTIYRTCNTLSGRALTDHVPDGPDKSQTIPPRQRVIGSRHVVGLVTGKSRNPSRPTRRNKTGIRRSRRSSRPIRSNTSGVNALASQKAARPSPSR